MATTITVNAPPRHHLKQDGTQIPELLLLMGPYWSPPDLYACIRVCKLWHLSLSPYLWHTIDDRLYSWPRILATHDICTSPGVKGYFRILSAFTRYGHFIRHMKLSWRVMIDIAFVTGVCTQLESLATGNLGVNRTRKEQESLRWVSNLTLEQGGLTYDQRQDPAKEGPLISAQLEGVFSPCEIGWRAVREQEQDWLTAQNFWGLVQMNAGSLRSLRLDRSLDSLAHLKSTEFFYVTLAGLPKLRELDNAFFTVRMTEVLERLPNLHTHRSSIFELHNQVLPETYTHLRALDIYGPVPSITFFSLLGRLPNLENFKISEFVRREVFPENPGLTYLNSTPTRLKKLHIVSGVANIGSNLGSKIIPWLPLLTAITVDRIQDGTAAALYTHCKHLDTILRADDGYTLMECVYQGATSPISQLYKLIHDFPNLKVIDRIDQCFAASDLLAQDWSLLNNNNNKAPTLQVFRCRIAHVERLTPSEEELMARASPEWISQLADTGTSDLVNKSIGSISIQRQILSRIGQLTNLRVLDLGYEWRDVWSSTRPETPRRGYIPYSKPCSSSLELSLATGLDLLAGLKNLCIFGFEGLDHRIGKPELEWMARNWPRLEVMRGLQEDDLIRIEPNPVKTELRLYMMKLRPEVRHESLSRLASLNV
ncbi:hypothetical protein EC991_010632 [Linnemannia zychae]|nr:hypothetical protein EC991_010632 [Linnemannia zychae]